ncbi:Gfo/Idh/MocA family oxidoreductase [Pelagibacteraceae bacterium]|nr:Gfo/Idh/MocA family oxidoreductase [Pelagibacteraceae bacterium]
MDNRWWQEYNLNILFIGLGSIGQRHLRILKKKHKKNVIFYLKKTNSNILINDDLVGKKIKSLSDYYKIQEVTDIQLLKINIDLTIITNPISKHYEYALKMIKLKSHIFIEKPLTDKFENAQKIIKASKKYGVNVYTGYQLRFHPGIKILKSLIKKKKIGKPISGIFYFGEFLPSTRKYIDYSKTHMAIKKLGGGAGLCLSHQLDLANYLLKDIKLKYSSVYKKSDLKINTEDNFKIVIEDKNKSTYFINLNFLDNPSNNYIKMNFSKGFIEWNYNKNFLLINNFKNTKIYKFRKFKRNRLFEDQLEYVLNNIKKNRFFCKNLYQSAKVVKIITDAKLN